MPPSLVVVVVLVSSDDCGEPPVTDERPRFTENAVAVVQLFVDFALPRHLFLGGCCMVLFCMAKTAYQPRIMGSDER